MRTRLKDDHVYLPTGEGHFISEKQRRVSEILQAYYPHLELQWVPPLQRGPQDYAFRIVDTTPGRPPYVVTHTNDCDERLLARVIQADNNQHNVLNYLDCHNAALELLEAKKRNENQMAMHEFTYSLLRSKKIHYRHAGLDFGAHNGGR